MPLSDYVVHSLNSSDPRGANASAEVVLSRRVATADGLEDATTVRRVVRVQMTPATDTVRDVLQRAAAKMDARLVKAAADRAAGRPIDLDTDAP